MFVNKYKIFASSWLGYITKTAGGLLILLGGTVIIGWYMNSATIVQLRPQLAPMQFNTALSFVLCASGLLLLYKKSRLAICCGSLSAGIALLTLLEYLFGISLGIDQFLFEPTITTKSAYPGRMSPLTALVHLLSGFSLLLLSGLWWKPRVCFLIARMFGMGVLALGLGNLLGYALGGGDTPFGWVHATYMAPHTAVGSIILGIGLLAFIWHRITGVERKKFHNLALESGLGLAVLAIILWQSLLTQGHLQTTQVVEKQVTELSEEIKLSLKYQVQALRRMAERWEYQGGTPQAFWKADAKNYLAHNLGLQAIFWVDSSKTLRWVESLSDNGNEAIEDLYLTFKSRETQLLETAREERANTAARNIELARGERATLVFTPLYNGDHFDGFIGGAFNIEKLLAPILFGLASRDYSVELFEGTEEVYRKVEPNRIYASSMIHEQPFSIINQTWRLRIQPSEALLLELKSPLPLVALIFSLMLALLTSLTMHYFYAAKLRADKQEILNQQLVAERTRDLEAINKHLFQEIQKHKLTSEALYTSEQYLRTVFNNILDGFIITDEKGMIESANLAALKMFGYTEEQLNGENVTMLMRESDRFNHASHVGRYSQTTKNKAHNEVGIWPLEVIALRKNGELFSMSVTLSELTMNKQRKFVAVLRDISKEKQAQKELEDSREKFRDLSVHLQTVREEERTRIARDVHDEVGQILTALNMDVHWLSEHIPKKEKEVLSKILSMQSLMSSSIESVQRITADLRPAMLDELGLGPAIQWYLDEFQERTGIKCKSEIELDEAWFDPGQATEIFRILQEALTNVIRHADASQISFCIKLDGDYIDMCLIDNGRGITQSEVNRDDAFGIIGMRERANAFDGSIIFEKNKNGGTTVSLRLPLNNNSKSI